AVKPYGANVVLGGEHFDEAYASATKSAKENNKEFTHPSADDAVVAGQGTVAGEPVEQPEAVEPTIVPIGGGGLVAG
ncbi:pyridoxal-phosphate dependent enzyme, partial [Aliarcobacter butzleri]|uniref:pyridoxal-phosphate dependent enzyme n=1 Tax=Aliarcobacter butzleri TaxID=28197 RepID=UPI003B21D234